MTMHSLWAVRLGWITVGLGIGVGLEAVGLARSVIVVAALVIGVAFWTALWSEILEG